ncbi:alpha/beta fold hydrolase [Lysobacter sp. cf310]|uniref:alpha/beta fold hydrolase n=1 Tax=Lysobacter sp. cf310 TaxID=1761790 RepID=UPI0008E84C08|nr:alpha/beta hydrolase [Lysobacter sp. cf310]SFK50745.1 Pimeloyl-ACP methyl ester carboxylesterase [Lysobacter sp. cf310]
MRWRRARLAAALVAAALFATVAVLLWRDPYRVVLADYNRQRILAGLSRDSLKLDDHRWVYAYNDEAPAGAPVLVMVHGFTGSKENWYPLAQRLRGRYRLLIPDLPGWGESQRRDGGDYGFVAQSARLARFIEQVARPRGGEVVLLGHSMGGGIAALTAARHPRAVDRLGLFDAAGVRFRDNRFGVQVLAGHNPFAVADGAGLQRYLDTVFYDAAAKPTIPWPADEIYIARRKRDAAFEQTVLNRIGRGPERFLPGEEAARIRQPTLLLWCRQDAVIDASAMALYAARMPQARQVLLDGCGHMSPVERPDAVAQAIAQLAGPP